MQAAVTGSRVPTPSQYPCGCTLKAPPLANLEQGCNILRPLTGYTDFLMMGKRSHQSVPVGSCPHSLCPQHKAGRPGTQGRSWPEEHSLLSPCLSAPWVSPPCKAAFSRYRFGPGNHLAGHMSHILPKSGANTDVLKLCQPGTAFTPPHSKPGGKAGILGGAQPTVTSPSQAPASAL